MTDLEKLLDTIDGAEAKYIGDNELARCDTCSEPIKPNREVQIYISNRGIHLESTGNLRIQRMYGEDCSLGRIKYPHEGTVEILLEAKFTKEKTIEDPEVIDHSGADDGYPWDPAELFEEMMGIEYMENYLATGGIDNGPEDIVDMLLLFDTDIREVVNENGEVDIGPEQREKIEKRRLDILSDMLQGEGPV